MYHIESLLTSETITYIHVFNFYASLDIDLSGNLRDRSRSKHTLAFISETDVCVINDLSCKKGFFGHVDNVVQISIRSIRPEQPAKDS